jgi:IS30 family transposase
MAMRRGYFRGFTAAESFGIAWQGGEALKAIGRAFGKPSSSIYFQLAPHGEFVLRHDAAQGWH